MIKIKHVVLPSAEQMKFVVESMRNPLNSWDKSDSVFCDEYGCDGCEFSECKEKWESESADTNLSFCIGNNDLSLMKRLAKAGTDHRKYLRQIPVMLRITAGHTWWAEFDTYKVGTVRNSCSKMHKIHSIEFNYDMFDHEGIDEIGFAESFKDYICSIEKIRNLYNETKEKKYWRALIEMLPMGFHLTANVTLNYEVLANMYHSRKNHKMFEWREFCDWIETLPYSEIITESKQEIAYADKQTDKPTVVFNSTGNFNTFIDSVGTLHIN